MRTHLSRLVVAVLAYGFTSCKPDDVPRQHEGLISGHELDGAEWAQDGHAEWVKDAYAKWVPLRPIVKALKGRGIDDTPMEAKVSLPGFKAAFLNPAFSGAAFAVKITWQTPHNQKPSSIWLGVRALKEGGLQTCPLEVPAGTSQLIIGHEVTVLDANINDWMIVHEEILYGGYSLGRFRSGLSEKDRADFDRQLNVRRHVPNPP